jgi:hypothetical protein
MQIVDRCAHEWGVELRDDGKTVCFEIDADTATPRDARIARQLRVRLE